MKRLVILFFLTMIIFSANAILDHPGSKTGCVSRGDENNGDCTHATLDDGTKYYFCEDSWFCHDCVKGM